MMFRHFVWLLLLLFRLGLTVEQKMSLKHDVLFCRMNGKTVGAQAGSAMLSELKAYDASLKSAGGTGLKKIVEYPSYPEAYQDLALGRTDAVVNTEINLRSLVAEKASVFALGEGVAQPVSIAWAMQKGNADFAKLVNEALASVRKSGKMYELQQKWFGVSFKDMPESVKK